jgi:hypothetical protein
MVQIGTEKLTVSHQIKKSFYIYGNKNIYSNSCRQTSKYVSKNYFFDSDT